MSKQIQRSSRQPLDERPSVLRPRAAQPRCGQRSVTKAWEPLHIVLSWVLLRANCLHIHMVEGQLQLSMVQPLSLLGQNKGLWLQSTMPRPTDQELLHRKSVAALTTMPMMCRICRYEACNRVEWFHYQLCLELFSNHPFGYHGCVLWAPHQQAEL